MKIIYTKSSSSLEAKTKVREGLRGHPKLGQFIKSIEENKLSLIAKGDGVTVEILFHEDHCIVDINLALLMRPFKSKIFHVIERELKEAI